MQDFGLIVAAVLLAWGATGLTVRALSGRRHHVIPNERSMHAVPTPAGGGIGIVTTIALLLPLWSWPMPFAQKIILAMMLLLALVSWIDDVRHLWPTTRLAAQTAAVVVALALVPDTWRIAPGIPFAVERAVTALAWIWFINLTNFMDGIDGIAASEAIAVALGYAGVATVAGLDKALEPLALVVAGASAGYLVWNWHPARIFMGDVGSIPLGFLLGWLMLDLAFHGHVAAALILPMYFLADATITLVRRLLNGETPWQPHRTHLYQRAVQGGASQDAVVLRVTVANTALILLAILSVRAPLPALAAAIAVTTLLMVSLWSSARGAGPSKTAKP